MTVELFQNVATKLETNEIHQNTRDRLDQLKSRVVAQNKSENYKTKLNDAMNQIVDKIVDLENILTQDTLSKFSPEELKNFVKYITGTRPDMGYKMLNEKGVTIQDPDFNKMFTAFGDASIIKYTFQIRRTEISDHVLNKVKENQQDKIEKSKLLEKVLSGWEVKKENATPMKMLTNAMYLVPNIKSRSERERLSTGMNKTASNIIDMKNLITTDTKIQILVGAGMMEIDASMTSELKVDHVYMDGDIIYAMMYNGCKGNLVVISKGKIESKKGKVPSEEEKKQKALEEEKKQKVLEEQQRRQKELEEKEKQPDNFEFTTFATSIRDTYDAITVNSTSEPITNIRVGDDIEDNKRKVVIDGYAFIFVYDATTSKITSIDVSTKAKKRTENYDISINNKEITLKLEEEDEVVETFDEIKFKKSIIDQYQFAGNDLISTDITSTQDQGGSQYKIALKGYEFVFSYDIQNNTSSLVSQKITHNGEEYNITLSTAGAKKDIQLEKLEQSDPELVKSIKKSYKSIENNGSNMDIKDISLGGMFGIAVQAAIINTYSCLFEKPVTDVPYDLQTKNYAIKDNIYYNIKVENISGSNQKHMVFEKEPDVSGITIKDMTGKELDKNVISPQYVAEKIVDADGNMQIPFKSCKIDKTITPHRITACEVDFSKSDDSEKFKQIYSTLRVLEKTRWADNANDVMKLGASGGIKSIPGVKNLPGLTQIQEFHFDGDTIDMLSANYEFPSAPNLKNITDAGIKKIFVKRLPTDNGVYQTYNTYLSINDILEYVNKNGGSLKPKDLQYANGEIHYIGIENIILSKEDGSEISYNVKSSLKDYLVTNYGRTRLSFADIQLTSGVLQEIKECSLKCPNAGSSKITLEFLEQIAYNAYYVGRTLSGKNGYRNIQEVSFKKDKIISFKGVYESANAPTLNQIKKCGIEKIWVDTIQTYNGKSIAVKCYLSLQDIGNKVNEDGNGNKYLGELAYQKGNIILK